MRRARAVPLGEAKPAVAFGGARVQFLMTPLARNWFFGTEYMDYGTPADSEYARNIFYASEAPAQFWRGMLLAALLSCLMMYVGLHAGRAMQRVKR